MAKIYTEFDEKLRKFIEAQHMFFVATAPLGQDGHVNLSPKGMDTLRILGPRSIAYLDYVGSGAETIAHVRENERITMMFCAFEGPPFILRLHGKGRIIEPQDAEYSNLRPMFPEAPPVRAIIHMTVHRMADSCGYSIPLYKFEKPRSQLMDWCERKGPEGLREYQIQKNSRSIDGLAALRWPEVDKT